MFGIFTELKRKLINWAYSEDDKFIHEVKVSDYKVWTNQGWKPFEGIGKTVKFDVWEIETDKGKKLFCADNHILIDENDNEIFTKDCIENKTRIKTKDGIETLIKVKRNDNKEHMFDLLDVDDSLYYTNDILSHNSTSFALYVLHYVLFNEYKNVVILANKEKQAKEILHRIKLAYTNLPFWLQQGAITWNKTEIQLENGCKVFAGTTASDSIRGETINLLIIDEAAHLSDTIWDPFWESVYPTISSSKSSRVIMVSTPLGMNYFYKMWKQALDKKNEFVPCEILWKEVPGYANVIDDKFVSMNDDDVIDVEYNNEIKAYSMKELHAGFTETDYKSMLIVHQGKKHSFKEVEFRYGNYHIIDGVFEKQTIGNLGRRKFQQEFNCKFLSSSNSLVDGEYMEDMTVLDPLPESYVTLYKDITKINDYYEGHISIYHDRIIGHDYIVGVDPAKITTESAGDSVAIQVIDITDIPYKQIATVVIGTGVHYMEIPELLNSIGRYYNNAYIFIETNDSVGQEMADTLNYTFEYENVYSQKPNVFGFRTTKKNKKKGALLLKMLIERYGLVICDATTITQLSTYTKKKNSYEAEQGYKDDAVAALIHSLLFLQDRPLFGEKIAELNETILDKTEKGLGIMEALKKIAKMKDKTPEEMRNNVRGIINNTSLSDIEDDDVPEFYSSIEDESSSSIF